MMVDGKRPGWGYFSWEEVKGFEFGSFGGDFALEIFGIG